MTWLMIMPNTAVLLAWIGQQAPDQQALECHTLEACCLGVCTSHKHRCSSFDSPWFNGVCEAQGWLTFNAFLVMQASGNNAPNRHAI